MASLYERIVAAADPARDAVVAPSGSLSYAQLLARAAALAERLSSGDRPLLLYGHKQPAMVVGIVAALRVGRAYVPVDPSAPPARIARMLDAARPGDAILIDDPPPALAEDLAARGVHTLQLDSLAAGLDSANGQVIPTQSRTADPEAPAYILFTSGTTGAPKGVPIPYRALAHFASWLLESQSLAPRAETFLNQAPFSFDLSVMELYGALLTGGTLFSIDRDEIADPRRLFARLSQAPLTVWVSTPSFARFCLAEPRFGGGMLPGLRRFLFCGETLLPTVARELSRRFPGVEVWNTYGPTETTVAVTGLRIEASRSASDEPLPVGWPFPGMEVWAADPDEPRQPRPAGATGEIVIAGPQVASGYLASPPSPGGPDRPTPFFTLADGRLAYRTGDLGRVDPASGLLYWEGRRDRQIKLHGYRLELDEIEATLRAVPGVVDAAVDVAERGGRPDHLVAYVVSSGDLPEDEVELTGFIRARLAVHLPPYALPRAARQLPALPLTANGKLDRRALGERR